jgi:hypothetical protein
MTTITLPEIVVSTQPQAATHWLVRDLFKLTAEASASHLSSYKLCYNCQVKVTIQPPPSI